jgi:16S rRNA (guanine527-N7)-methyltransferase
MNLVSRKDIDRLVSYHFCDSAAVLPLVGRWDGLKVLDVGGSNGLPGLVLASLVPRIRLTICDARQKRRGFLDDACAGLGAAFEMDRVDTKAFQGRHRRSFDLILARAVTQMRLLARWCMPLLAAGGRLIAYKGSGCVEEVKQAHAGIFGQGGTMAAVVASPWAHACNPLRLFAIVKFGHDPGSRPAGAGGADPERSWGWECG